MLWLVSQQELIRVLRCEECEDQQQSCSYHRQSQQDQLCQLSPEKASIAGNISLIWKLRTICFILSENNHFSSPRKYQRPVLPPPPNSSDRLNSARYIKPLALPNTSIKTIVLENNKNLQTKSFVKHDK